MCHYGPCMFDWIQVWGGGVVNRSPLWAARSWIRALVLIGSLNTGGARVHERGVHSGLLWTPPPPESSQACMGHHRLDRTCGTNHPPLVRLDTSPSLRSYWIAESARSDWVSFSTVNRHWSMVKWWKSSWKWPFRATLASWCWRTRCSSVLYDSCSTWAANRLEPRLLQARVLFDWIEVRLGEGAWGLGHPRHGSTIVGPTRGPLRIPPPHPNPVNRLLAQYYCGRLTSPYLKSQTKYWSQCHKNEHVSAWTSPIETVCLDFGGFRGSDVLPAGANVGCTLRASCADIRGAVRLEFRYESTLLRLFQHRSPTTNGSVSNFDHACAVAAWYANVADGIYDQFVLVKPTSVKRNTASSGNCHAN